jgi:hypothetical protein
MLVLGSALFSCPISPLSPEGKAPTPSNGEMNMYKTIPLNCQKTPPNEKPDCETCQTSLPCHKRRHPK